MISSALVHDDHDTVLILLWIAIRNDDLGHNVNMCMSTVGVFSLPGPIYIKHYRVEKKAANIAKQDTI